MWGRLDASAFLFALLDDRGEPLTNDAKRLVQASIVREEASHICAAVIEDRKAGASSPRGQKLLNKATHIEPNTSWEEVCGLLDISSPPDSVEAKEEFLVRCRIGEESIGDELSTGLMARVGVRASATALTVLRRADLPLAGILDKGLAPLRGALVIANRYTQAIRPRPGSRPRAWPSRVGAAVSLAAPLSLSAKNLGVVAPIVWLAVAAVLLVYAVVAPLTSVLTILLVAIVGFASVMPTSWVPASYPHWLPLERWQAALAITVALVAISWPGVDAADKFLRRILRRGLVTRNAMRLRLQRSDELLVSRILCVGVAVALPALKWWQLRGGSDASDLDRQLVLLAGVSIAAVVVARHHLASLGGDQIALPAPAPQSRWLADWRWARFVLAIGAPMLCGLSVLAHLSGSSTRGTTLIACSALVPLAALAIWERKRELGWRSLGGIGEAPDRALLWTVAPATLLWVGVLGLSAIRGVDFGMDLGGFELAGVHGAGGKALGTVVVIGFGEEILFRGLLLVLAVRAGLDRVGFALVSLSFAAWHIPDALPDGGWTLEASWNVGLTVAAMFAVSQAIFVPLRLRCRSLGGPALLHAANNLSLRLI